MADDEKENSGSSDAKTGCAITSVSLVILGLIIFGVFQCTRCVFFTPSPPTAEERIIEARQRLAAATTTEEATSAQAELRRLSGMHRETATAVAVRSNPEVVALRESMARARAKAATSGTTSRNQQSLTRNRSDIERECERRFAQRKSHVLDLSERGLLDAYGLSDIGVLNEYGISVQAAPAVLDILEVNGLYGLQNDYSGVARAVCAEVAHDEILIQDGTRDAFVNR